MPTVVHEAAVELAVLVHELSIERHATAPNDIIRDAFFVLSHDIICVHRALGALVDDGWSSPAGALLRTLMDINVSALAIANSNNSRMAAFKYLYAGLRRHCRDQGLPSTARRQMFAQIRRRIEQLPGDLRAQALNVLKEKDRPYWFSPEWSSPSAVLEAFGIEDLRWAYMQASSAAHGTFFGMRLFRDDPDALNINPRAVGPKAEGLELMSCRWLVEFLRVRDAVEQLGMAVGIDIFVRRLSEVAAESRTG